LAILSSIKPQAVALVAESVLIAEYILRAVVRNFEPAAHAYSLSLKSASLPLSDGPLNSVVVVKQAAV
jgi:hypothetical protein